MIYINDENSTQVLGHNFCGKLKRILLSFPKMQSGKDLHQFLAVSVLIMSTQTGLIATHRLKHNNNI